MPGHRVFYLVMCSRGVLTPVILVNKSGAICKFLSCVTVTRHSMLPVTLFVL
ncbi:hypothetical protein LEADMM271B_17050 [Leclercia adecarboxylata]